MDEKEMAAKALKLSEKLDETLQEFYKEMTAEEVDLGSALEINMAAAGSALLRQVLVTYSLTRDENVCKDICDSLLETFADAKTEIDNSAETKH